MGVNVRQGYRSGKAGKAGRTDRTGRWRRDSPCASLRGGSEGADEAIGWLAHRLQQPKAPLLAEHVCQVYGKRLTAFRRLPHQRVRDNFRAGILELAIMAGRGW